MKLLTLRHEWNGWHLHRHCQTHFLEIYFSFWSEFHWRFFLSFQLILCQHWFIGCDKPLRDPIMIQFHDVCLYYNYARNSTARRGLSSWNLYMRLWTRSSLAQVMVWHTLRKGKNIRTMSRTTTGCRRTCWNGTYWNLRWDNNCYRRFMTPTFPWYLCFTFQK